MFRKFVFELIANATVAGAASYIGRKGLTRRVRAWRQLWLARDALLDAGGGGDGVGGADGGWEQRVQTQARGEGKGGRACRITGSHGCGI